MRKMSKLHMPNSFLHFAFQCISMQIVSIHHASIILCFKLNVAFVNAQPGKCLISCHAQRV